MDDDESQPAAYSDNFGDAAMVGSSSPPPTTTTSCQRRNDHHHHLPPAQQQHLFGTARATTSPQKFDTGMMNQRQGRQRQLQDPPPPPVIVRQRTPLLSWQLRLPPLDCCSKIVQSGGGGGGTLTTTSMLCHDRQRRQKRRYYHYYNSIAVMVVVVIGLMLWFNNSSYDSHWWRYIQRYYRLRDYAIPATIRNEQHLYQLDLVYQQILRKLRHRHHHQQPSSSFNNSQQRQRDDEPIRLHPSFLSRPPFVSTQPTVIVSPRHSRSRRNNTARSKWQCTLQSPPTHLWTMVRIILFQRNGGKQLQTFLTHYLSVLPSDSLVIIDHESHPNSLTSQVLSHYRTNGSSSDSGSTKGGHIHIWNCQGSYVHHRAIMWSSVVRVYQYDSAIVIPVDVDELLAVIVNHHNDSTTTAGMHPPTYPYNNVTRLVWDTHSLYTTLSNMLKLHPNNNYPRKLTPSGGKPFKMQFAEPIPGDCHVTDTLLETMHLSGNHTRIRRSFPSAMCDLSYLVVDARPIPYSCMHKCFARGQDFVRTDLGNHFLVTQRTVDLYPHKHPKYSVIQNCEQDGVVAHFDLSPLVIVHLQKLNFDDWILHYIRGASMHGYSKDGGLVNCTGAKVASHYCGQWHEFQTLNFSLDALRHIYHERYCHPHSPRQNNPSIVPLSNVFDHGCLR